MGDVCIEMIKLSPDIFIYRYQQIILVCAQVRLLSRRYKEYIDKNGDNLWKRISNMLNIKDLNWYKLTNHKIFIYKYIHDRMNNYHTRSLKTKNYYGYNSDYNINIYNQLVKQIDNCRNMYLSCNDNGYVLIKHSKNILIITFPDGTIEKIWVNNFVTAPGFILSYKYDIQIKKYNDFELYNLNNKQVESLSEIKSSDYPNVGLDEVIIVTSDNKIRGLNKYGQILWEHNKCNHKLLGNGLIRLNDYDLHNVFNGTKIMKLSKLILSSRIYKSGVILYY